MIRSSIAAKAAVVLLAVAASLSHAQAGLQWKARWIAAQPDQGSVADLPARMPIFRTAFQVTHPLAEAKLYICGPGQFEAHINGRNVSDAVMTPGWTNYRKRVFYDAYDVTSLLRPGANALGVMLGNGMFNVQETKGRYTKFAASFGQPRLIAQLELRFTDGSRQTLITDGNWTTAPGPITFSSTYGGEDYDARLEHAGWDQPAFDGAGWSPATVVSGPGGNLVPETIPPVKTFDTFKPIAVTHPGVGISVYDLGQNFAGWPEIQVSGDRGAKLTLVSGELLDDTGMVSQRSAGASPDAQNRFTYVLKGGGTEQWHPRFSYYGFRYVQVQQSDGEAEILHLQGDALHDSVDVVGAFSTSDPLLTRIHALINHAMLNNMVSVLTDCPHREKLGWLEQTHLAGPSLFYNYDLQALYANLADDIEDSQLPNGMVPSIAPEYPVFEGAFRDSPEWGSAIILSSWNAYQFSGDKSGLAQHYDSMSRYIKYLQGRTENHLLTYGLGDWYDVGPGPPGESKLTTKGLTATATYYQDLRAMARIAVLTGHGADADQYKQEGILVKAAFNARFFNPSTHSYDRGSQTANAMPLVLDLAPEAERAAVLRNLVSDIRAHDDRVTAGDIGFHYLVRALTDNGRSDVLYDMVSRIKTPSYGYQLAHGATSLTEAWDANPESSQDHFMLGHAEEWFYRGLAGIDFDLERERDAQITIRPAIVGDLHDARASYRSTLGTIESGWVRSGKSMSITVSIPRGRTATIVFPDEYTSAISVNGRPLKSGGPIRSISGSEGVRRCIVRGGAYIFTLSKP